MLTIKTRFHGPTDTKGSRVSATLADGSLRKYLSWDHRLSSIENHDAAAIALYREATKRFNAPPTRFLVRLEDRNGYVYGREDAAKVDTWPDNNADRPLDAFRFWDEVAP